MDTRPKTKTKTLFKILIRLIIIGAFTLQFLQAGSAFNTYEIPSQKPEGKKTPEEILKDIYKEVFELGKREDENFIKGEFHFNLDENPTNSEEHIVVLIYEAENKERMIVQVTYFEAEGLKYSVKYAKDIKLVTCTLDGEILKIDKCDFKDKEMKSLMRDILKGIQEEKKLYKLIDKKIIRQSAQA